MAEKKETVSTENKRFAKPGDTVELIVGDQWVDDLSGISLYRGFYRLASRDEIKRDKMAKEFGYIKEEEMQPTAVLPDDKDLSRVEKAIRLGILKIYDPKNPTIYVERGPGKHRRVTDSETDAGSRYATQNDEKIASLLKLKFLDFKSEIKKFKSITMLEQVYEAECEGRNPTAAARKLFVEAIRSRMKDSDVSGVSKVSSKVSEIVRIE